MAAESWVLDGLDLNVPDVAQLTNLITNPSFEIDTAGWFPNGRANLSNSALSITRITSQQWSGSASLQVVTNGSFAEEGAAFDFTGGGAFTFASGVTYSLSAYIRSSTSTATVQVGLGSTGVLDRGQSTATALSTSWQRITATWTPAASRSDAALVVKTSGTAAATFQIDGLLVFQASAVTSYFDGTTPGYKWSGTAHASTSVPAPPIKLLDLTADPPPARRDWITAADSEAAALFRQPLHENRTITMKLRITPQASMDTALDHVGALVDKLRSASATPAGIALVWTPGASARPRTFTVLAGQIIELPIALGGHGYSWVLRAPIVTVELICNPYWLGTETLTSTASSSTPFVTKEVTGVTGDVPALGRLIITDTATQSRRHVEWGVEGQFYNAATSSLIDSDDMVTSGFGGAQATVSGSYDPNASGNNAITVTTPPRSTTAVCGTGNLSHVGVFRVKARVIPPTETTLVRFSWRAGDGPTTSNEWVQARSGYSELDLGTITIPVALSGTQRWTGQIEVQETSTSGGVFAVDYLILIPALEGYGKARATFNFVAGPIVGYDGFVGTTAAAVLNARAAPVGGTWATSGDATDFVFADNFNVGVLDGVESVSRSTAVAETTGRFAILGASNYTDVQVDVRSHVVKGFPKSYEQAVVARWTDSSNHLRLTVISQQGVRIEQVVAGVVTTLAASTWIRQEKTNYRYRLIAFASGRVVGQVLSDVGVPLVELQASSSVLATAGALATGKPGLRDRSSGTTVAARYFTEFSVSTPAAEPIVLYSGRTMQVRYDDVIRDDSTGTYTGRPQSYRGSRFLVPVGTSRVFVKARRQDADVTTDDFVTDATQIQIGWTPRGLAVPRA